MSYLSQLMQQENGPLLQTNDDAKAEITQHEAVRKLMGILFLKFALIKLIPSDKLFPKLSRSGHSKRINDLVDNSLRNIFAEDNQSDQERELWQSIPKPKQSAFRDAIKEVILAIGQECNNDDLKYIVHIATTLGGQQNSSSMVYDLVSGQNALVFPFSGDTENQFKKYWDEQKSLYQLSQKLLRDISLYNCSFLLSYMTRLGYLIYRGQRPDQLDTAVTLIATWEFLNIGMFGRLTFQLVEIGKLNYTNTFMVLMAQFLFTRLGKIIFDACSNYPLAAGLLEAACYLAVTAMVNYFFFRLNVQEVWQGLALSQKSLSGDHQPSRDIFLDHIALRIHQKWTMMIAGAQAKGVIPRPVAANITPVGPQRKMQAMVIECLTQPVPRKPKRWHDQLLEGLNPLPLVRQIMPRVLPADIHLADDARLIPIFIRNKDHYVFFNADLGAFLTARSIKAEYVADMIRHKGFARPKGENGLRPVAKDGEGTAEQRNQLKDSEAIKLKLLRIDLRPVFLLMERAAEENLFAQNDVPPPQRRPVYEYQGMDLKHQS